VGSSALTGTLVAIVALALASVFGLWWRARDGRVIATAPADADADVSGGDREVTAEDAALARLGVAAGTPVTLLQFSSAFCAPCRVARRICADLAGGRDGVAHLEVDAESHLDEVRALGVWRTPTVLVVDATGRIAFRLAGAPSRAGLAAAVDSLAPQAVA
jgi:hypothetical protein